MTIFEAQKRKKVIIEKMSELRSKRNANSTSSYLTNETPLVPEESVSSLSNEIVLLNTELLNLNCKIRKANASTILKIEGLGRTIDANGNYANESEVSELNILEALDLMSFAKKEASYFERMIKLDSVSRKTTYNGDVEYTKTNFDKPVMEALFNHYTGMAEKLQFEVDKANMLTEI